MITGTPARCVRPNGPGLPGDLVPLATRAFWRAPAVQNVEGSGLGLPIVAALMRASHGSLEIRADAPQGLHVVLGLPAATDATEPVPAADHPPQPASLLEV